MAIIPEREDRMNFCDYCLLKDGVCAHLKTVMKHALRNTDIDGSQLCPLILSAKEEKKSPCSQESDKL